MRSFTSTRTCCTCRVKLSPCAPTHLHRYGLHSHKQSISTVNVLLGRRRGPTVIAAKMHDPRCRAKPRKLGARNLSKLKPGDVMLGDIATPGWRKIHQRFADLADRRHSGVAGVQRACQSMLS
ncbi:hypothetical protein BaRGS_00018185 [Batillaria attramentaria]|uniref:Uncharacterized protein n=1 Tax=Batillaria attramentaria TaxID=370345 RepID=A0ABD0KU34_9CAEN